MLGKDRNIVGSVRAIEHCSELNALLLRSWTVGICYAMQGPV